MTNHIFEVGDLLVAPYVPGGPKNLQPCDETDWRFPRVSRVVWTGLDDNLRCVRLVDVAASPDDAYYVGENWVVCEDWSELIPCSPAIRAAIELLSLIHI